MHFVNPLQFVILSFLLANKPSTDYNGGVHAFTCPLPRRLPLLRLRFQHDRYFTSPLANTVTKDPSIVSSSYLQILKNSDSDTINSKRLSLTKSLRSIIKFISFYIHRIFWPGYLTQDDSNAAPLPAAAPPGCPFIGNNLIGRSKTKGPEYFYSEMSAKLGHPPIWSFYFLTKKFAAVSGSKNVKSVFQNEYAKFDVVGFDAGEIKGIEKNSKQQKSSLYSSNNVMFERNKEKHQFLRRLVGMSVTKRAIERGMPEILGAVEEQIETLICHYKNSLTRSKQAPIHMEDICEKFTLDIAWRHIIGLNLLKDNGREIPKFHKAVNDYVSGIFSVLVMLNIPGKTLFLPQYRARRYLQSKIIERIDELEENGPDGSTLSAMVFETDDEDEDKKKKLTRTEIIENALIMLVAGTETTASSLTSAIFLLGLHPQVWKKVVAEQKQLRQSEGNNTTFVNKILDDECPYLDAVIKETLRIVPLSGGNFRTAKETVLISGKQVPKGMNVFCNIRLTHELDPITQNYLSLDEEEDDDINCDYKPTKSHNMDPVTGFKPERWLREETRPKDEYIPFGTGPRRCLGSSLAVTEMRIFLASLAHKVESFELVGTGSNNNLGSKKKIYWKPASIIPKPDDGVPIKIVKLVSS